MARKQKQRKVDVFEHPDANMREIPISDMMKERFSSYSKYVLESRSLPDLRDGLLPVHRRILFSMYKSRYFSKGKTVKSAKTVGNVMATYHP